MCGLPSKHVHKDVHFIDACVQTYIRSSLSAEVAIRATVFTPQLQFRSRGSSPLSPLPWSSLSSRIICDTFARSVPRI